MQREWDPPKRGSQYEYGFPVKGLSLGSEYESEVWQEESAAFRKERPVLDSRAGHVAQKSGERESLYGSSSNEEQSLDVANAVVPVRKHSTHPHTIDTSNTPIHHTYNAG